MKSGYHILESLFFICFGGLVYYFIEITFRGFSHYSMFLCGGVIFYLISLFNRRYSASLHFVTRMIIATFIITAIELIFGIIFNLILHRQVWDYSAHYYHYKGQICLTFSILWFFLTPLVLYLEMFLRHFLFSNSVQ